MKKYISVVILLPSFLCACVGVVDSKPNEEKVINVTYLQAGLDGRIRMAVPLTPERLIKSGTSKVLKSDSLYSLLAKISSRGCTLKKDENLIGLARAEGVEVQVLFNKKIATSKGVCNIPFAEADNIINKLGLKFAHHDKGYDLF